MAQVTRFVRDIDGKLVVDAATGKPITVTYETTGGGAVDSVNGKVGVVVLDAEDVGAEPAFEKKSAFNKEFGTEAGTVCQGNDSRLSDARPANGGNSATVGGKSPSDFATSEQGAKADTAYQKPVTGIPESDLSQDVQALLNRPIPSKTSELVNDSDFITSATADATYAKQNGTYPNMTVGNAQKATQDGEGNNIAATYAKKTFLQNFYFARTGVLTANLVTEKPVASAANYLATTTTNTTIDFNSAQKITISRVLQDNLEISNQNALGLSLAFACNRNAEVEFAARVFVDNEQISQGQAFGLRSYNGSNDFTNVNELTASIALDLVQGVRTFNAGQTLKIEIVSRQVATSTLNMRYFCGVSVSGIERNSFAKFDISNTIVNTNQIANGAVTEAKLSPEVQTKLNETYTLPIASATTLGGVQPDTKTTEMTQAVGVDETGKLWTAPGSGGGGGSNPPVIDLGTTTSGSTVSITTEQKETLSSNASAKIKVEIDDIIYYAERQLSTSDGSTMLFAANVAVSTSNIMAIAINVVGTECTPVTVSINTGGGGGEVTKEAIANALGLTTQQLDQLSALAKKLTVSGNNVTFTSGTTLQATYFDAID